MSNKIYGYARCSTNEEKQDITRQINDLLEMGCSRENIYLEYVSGSKSKDDRIEFTRLLDVIETGATVCVTELSRLSRSMKDLLSILDIFKDKRIKVILGTFILDFRNGDADPMVMAMVSVMGVFSQMERELTSQRTKSGMANAKANGKQIGLKEGTILKLDDKIKKYIKMHLQDPKIMTKTEINKLTGCSRVTINKYIKLCMDNPDLLK